jgi:hypothetical protein
MRQSRTRWFIQSLENARGKERADRKLKRKVYIKKNRIVDFW